MTGYPPKRQEKPTCLVCRVLVHVTGAMDFKSTITLLSDGMRRPVSAGCDTLPMFDVLEAQRKGDRL
jgi:hypothetical protein